MKFDLNILKDYIKNGWVQKTDSPIHPLSIYNYSRETQYSGKWDEITLKCRGLVLDNEGNVVAKSFDKFFNLEEHNPKDIPMDSFEVYDKLDGSLILLFNYGGEWVFASKGSFNSDQSNLAKKLFEELYSYEYLSSHYVYLFELIGPSNRIVVEYPEDNLVLLAINDRSDWSERNIYTDASNNFVKVKIFDGVNDFSTLKNVIPNDKEGFVVKFKNGFRMKIKGEEYVRLHRLITGFSNVNVWEYLKDGKDFNELLVNIPDEFDSWFKETKSSLNYSFYSLNNEVGKLFDYYMYGKYNDQEPVTDRKVFAGWVLKQKKWMWSILFNMFDGKKYDDIIWRLIKPKYEKPKWIKNDEYELDKY
jgi:RNA ligase